MVMAMSASRRDSEKERGTGTSWIVRSRMLRGQRAEPRREEGDAETVGRADAHRARNILALAGDLGAGGDHVGFHALGDGQETLAGRRQFAAGGEAAKQLCAERLLERGDAARDRGVVESEPPRRAEDLAGAGDGEEDADVIPVHADCFLLDVLDATSARSHARCRLVAR